MPTTSVGVASCLKRSSFNREAAPVVAGLSGATTGGGFRADRVMNVYARPSAIRSLDPHRSAAVVFLLLLCTAALMVAARRLAGALTHPLEPAALLAVGLIVAIIAAMIRLALQFGRATMLLTSLAVLGLAAGLCLPETNVTGKFLFCALLVVEESWAWARHKRRHQTAQDCPLPATTPRAAAIPATADREISSDPFLMQQLTRSQAADGSEEIAGWLRVAFAAGQRTGNAHVAFCPPLAGTPAFEVEQIDGPDARIKTAQVLPYGARLDLKLAAATEEPVSVLLQFSAHSGNEHQ